MFVNKVILGSLCAGVAASLGLALPASAQVASAEQVIRPSKMLSVESAGTLPAGANLMSISGTDLEYYRGLTDRLQIEVGTGGLNVMGPTNMSVRAQAKYALYENGPLALGGGVGASSRMAGLATPGYGGTVFAPVSLALLPGLSVNMVPRFSMDTTPHAGIELGLAYALLPNVLAIAEDHVADFGNVQHDILLGSAYTGFGPRTTLAFGLVSGDGSANRPYSVGLGATLHHGF